MLPLLAPICLQAPTVSRQLAACRAAGRPTTAGPQCQLRPSARTALAASGKACLVLAVVGVQESSLLGLLLF